MRSHADNFWNRFPQLRSSYPVSFYIEMVCGCSVLKTVWYSLRFRGLVLVGRRCRIKVHRSAQICLAPKSTLLIGMANDTPVGAALRLRPRSRMYVEGRVQIMRASSITVGYNAVFRVGADTFFNDGSSVLCFISTTIGPGCAIASGTRILDTDVHRLVGTGNTGPHAPVNIGKNCWIGTSAVILKGVHLGDGSVVAAGAVVGSDSPARSLIAGIPARVIREDIMWER